MPIQKLVKVNNSSIEQAGLSRDFKSDISEFIWNGFDAKAKIVEIRYGINELEGIDSLTISDNGEGIIFNKLESTFGILLDSSKNSIRGTSSYIHGKKGIGRFSFQYFSSTAEWTSVYEQQGKKYRFSITINSDNKENFIISDQEEVAMGTETGCSVKFYNLDKVVSQLVTGDFTDFLRREFGWYLYLNKARNYKLKINDQELDYDSSIETTAQKTIILSHGDEAYKFDLNFIEWVKNTGDDYYYNYFLDSNFIEKHKKTTSFNKNGINFHHSVYIISDYFDHYVPSSERAESQQSLFDSDEIFKLLNQELHKFLAEQQKIFINRNSELLIQELESEDVFPEFEENELGEERKKEFITITKSLYRVQPRLFIKVGNLQKKSFLGFLKLLIDSNERENIIKIIESIVEMTSEERGELVQVLQYTTLSKIVITMKDVIERIKNIEILKTLVFDYEVYTTERDHIQKIMEKCFWLFGEQYSLISADETFVKALRRYHIEMINRSLPDYQKLLEDGEANRRPDLFLCRQYPHTNSASRLGEDNIIVELKRPIVDIGIEQMRQIEDYMNFIIRQSEFSGTTRKWKFYIVGKNLTTEVKAKVEENQNRGEEQFLYDRLGNYAIYAINWDDLFQSFKLKAGFILNKLNIKKELITDELIKEGIEPLNIPDYLTSLVIGAEQPVNPSPTV